MPSVVGAEPKAIVVVSAHYMVKDVVEVASGDAPEMLFDYYGFPREAYKYKYNGKNLLVDFK